MDATRFVQGPGAGERTWEEPGDNAITKQRKTSKAGVTENEGRVAAHQASQIKGKHIEGDVCSCCGDHGSLVVCARCPVVICMAISDGESGCLLEREINELCPGNIEFLCPRSSQQAGKSFDFTLRANHKTRFIWHRTFRPLILGCLLHGNPAHHPFLQILDNTMTAEYSRHWKDGIHVSRQSMTKYGPSQSGIRLCHKYAVENDDADLVVCLDTDCDSNTGNLVAFTNEDGGISTSVGKLIDIYIENATISKVSRRKGIVLMTCGGATTCTSAFDNLCNYMQRAAFQFPIGFTAPSIIPGNVVLPLVAAIRLICPFDTPPLLAVEETFGGGGQALHHSGVVVVTQDEAKNITANEFVYGPPGSLPWGLPSPPCLRCAQLGRPSNTRPTRVQNETNLRRVQFHCPPCSLRIQGYIERLNG
ncbi:hypothetical protein K439DRAFT_1618320 [Ramaria rubella]|nr:hypothetical protein K439DRAFT_1618320 [Ramaria rubella]